jgi:hypothetical protein
VPARDWAQNKRVQKSFVHDDHPLLNWIYPLLSFCQAGFESARTHYLLHEPDQTETSRSRNVRSCICSNISAGNVEVKRGSGSRTATGAEPVGSGGGEVDLLGAFGSRSSGKKRRPQTQRKRRGPHVRPSVRGTKTKGRSPTKALKTRPRNKYDWDTTSLNSNPTPN